ncbi:MAG: hypothetical protein ACLU38_11720 [Dysosmobacter sp.]
MAAWLAAMRRGRQMCEASGGGKPHAFYSHSPHQGHLMDTENAPAQRRSPSWTPLAKGLENSCRVSGCTVAGHHRHT